MITFKNLALRVIDGTSNASSGTVSTHAHGLGYAPSLNRMMVTSEAGDNNTESDTEGARVVAVIKSDKTNVTVKSEGDSVDFTLFIWLNENAATDNNDR